MLRERVAKIGIMLKRRVTKTSTHTESVKAEGALAIRNLPAQNNDAQLWKVRLLAEMKDA